MEAAILLAAGRGRKMWPYSSTNAKGALPIANEPILARQVRILRELGIADIVVAAGYRASQLRWALRNLGPVVFVEETVCSEGTAPALLVALQQGRAGRVLVLYGDTVWSRESMAAFVERGRQLDPAQMLAAVLPLGGERPQEWICAAVQEGLVREILGHPRDGVTHRLAGAFVVDGQIEHYLREQPGQMRFVQVGAMPPDELTLEGALAAFLKDGGEIVAHEVSPPWFDVDKPWHLLEANEAILRYEGQLLEGSAIHPSARISPKAEIEGPLVVEEGATVGPHVRIAGPAWIGRNAVVTDGAILEGFNAIGEGALVRQYCLVGRATAVGPDCVLGHATEFSGLMFHGAYAYHYGEFWGILGAKSDLGAATVCGNLRFDDDDTVHNIGGHREKPHFGANAAYLGDFVRTGVNVILMPGVKIGPYSVIGPGTIVTEDVPDGTLLYVEQQLVRKRWGPERYGW
ncbi:MAG: NDP-sugar synthase [candidate division KSB1 bacterium]|nr:NDP-sugar synthase [candidate division KSB1 bacterium]